MAAVGVVEILEIAAGLDNGVEEIEEWCLARGIEPSAVVRMGENQARAILLAMRRLEGAPSEILASAAILGFQIGLEVERRRRDAELMSQ